MIMISLSSKSLQACFFFLHRHKMGKEQESLPSFSSSPQELELPFSIRETYVGNQAKTVR